MPQPAAAGSAALLMIRIDPEDSWNQNISRINSQVMKMAETTRKLMGITRYETKDYPRGRIVNFDRSSGEGS